jgi:hypothetical protein
VSIPEDLDMDRVLSAALEIIETAVQGWSSGAPMSEEPLMSRLTEQFSRRRRQCDVGARVPVAMIARIAFLHRQGANQTDEYGADLAVTIEIPDRAYRKTALFQLKVSKDFSAELKRGQLEQSLADDRIKDRSFLLVADKVRQRIRVKSVADTLNLFSYGCKSAQINCAEWLGISEWLIKWISCNVGQASCHNDPRSVEALLQSFVVEAPDDWERPWGQGKYGNYPSNQTPAKAWLEMIFRRVAGSEEKR